jgi:beta-1,4-N-acetylglucosaminyltransferase
MRIFVTVGTTGFESLIKFVDTLESIHDFYLQIGPTKYQPVNTPYIQYIVDIGQEYANADIVISHCGAGSTYKLLELDVPLIVVPNLERVDQHQKDLANFLDNGSFAYVAWSLEDIKGFIEDICLNGDKTIPFVKEPFNAGAILQKIILNEVKS